ETTYYFDAVEIAKSDCGISGIFHVSVEDLEIYPNPTTDVLIVGKTEDLRTFHILNIMGQVVSRHVTTGQSVVELDVQNLTSGVYVLAAFDKYGTLQASGRFVKE